MVVEAVRRPWRAAVGALFMSCAGLAHPQQPAVTPQLQMCMACHGPQGNSQIPTTPSLAGQPSLFIENQLVLIREGLREVPAMQALMKDIDDASITALATHFSTQPVTARAPKALDQGRLARGADLSQQRRCGTCHLADYAGQQQVPRLTGQSEPYLLQSMQQFRDHPGPGRDTIMAATLLGLSNQDLADLAHYLAARKP
jgi:cytochrome c553